MIPPDREAGFARRPGCRENRPLRPMRKDTYASAPPVSHTALNISKQCNQKCVFCFEGGRKGWDHPSLEEIKGKLSALAESGDNEIIFMGAEALLRSDIVEIIRFATSVGINLTAFTNGQIFARDGFVEEMAQAGMMKYMVSAHYADADSFSKGTRTPARFFERFCLGLENLSRYNEKNPGRLVYIGPKTMLFSHNYGKLRAINDLLRRHLRGSFQSHMIGTILPFVEGAVPGLLEPVEGRRQEIIAFMKSGTPEVAINFSMVPLCLIPGWEHYSFDVKIIADNIRQMCNFRDKSRLESMPSYLEDYRANAYRWVCRECNLLAICPTLRSTWKSSNFFPSKEQKFLPVLDRTPEDILRKILELGELKRPTKMFDRVRANAVRLRDIPLPEYALAQSLRSLDGGGVRVGEIFCEREPIFKAVLVIQGLSSTLHIGYPRAGAPAGHIVQYLCVTAEGAAAADRELLAKALRALASASLPKLSAWKDFARYSPAVAFNPVLARITWQLWKLFGESLWPASGTIGGWTVRRLEFPEEGAVRIAVSSPSGRSAGLMFYPTDREQPAPPGKAALDPVEAPELKIVFDAPADLLKDEAGLVELRSLRERLSAAFEPKGRKAAASAGILPGRAPSPRARAFPESLRMALAKLLESRLLGGRTARWGRYSLEKVFLRPGENCVWLRLRRDPAPATDERSGVLVRLFRIESPKEKCAARLGSLGISFDSDSKGLESALARKLARSLIAVLSQALSEAGPSPSEAAP